MKHLIQGAIQEAASQLLDVTRTLRADRSMAPDAVLQRYEQQHRGRADAMIDFARRMAPGADPLREAVRYEKEMERRLQARGR